MADLLQKEERPVEQTSARDSTNNNPILNSTALLTDAVLISIISAVSYLVAFKYEQSYLSYFGISDQFIDLSLERVVLAFSTILAFFVSLYYILNVLSQFLRPGVKFFISCFPIEIFIFIIVAIIYFMAGVNWLTVILFAIFLIFILNHVVGVARKLWNGLPWKDWFISYSKTVSEPPTRPDLESILIQKFGLRNWAIAALFVYILPTLGNMAGSYIAIHKRNFETYSTDTSEAILVTQKGDTWVFSELWKDKITGKLVLIKINPSQPLILTEKIYGNGIFGVGFPNHKPTMKEWWNGVWNKKPREQFGR